MRNAVFAGALLARLLAGDPLPCDFSAYKALPGLNAALAGEVLTLTWDGDSSQAVRLRFANRGGTPVIEELAVRPTGGAWAPLATNVTPEFTIASGQRSEVPVAAQYHVRGCEVKTNGDRIEASFPGVDLGVFSGRLQYTVYRGTNLIRLEVVAGANQPPAAVKSVTWKYDAGLKGMHFEYDSRLAWRDTASNWQEYRFDGAIDGGEVPLKTAHRQLIAGRGKAGSISVFPPPHAFFRTHETESSAGGNWYRRDSEFSFSFGIRQADFEESGRMAVYLYPNAGPASDTAAGVLAFTHGDRFKAVPGYQAMQNPEVADNHGVAVGCLCDRRFLSLLDDMNNRAADQPIPLKHILAIAETRDKAPAGEVYAASLANYVKLDPVPSNVPSRGDYFVTSGEVLIDSLNLEGSGNDRTMIADLEWTFPMEYVEVVWGDGQKTGSKSLPATGMPPFGHYQLRIPFSAAGQKWVRFAAWDSAGDGAMSQPVKLAKQAE